jgi:hypothetical protein
MPTPTYTALANLTLSATAASVSFSSISQAYTDLVLVADASASTTAELYLRFNSDTSVYYQWQLMSGNGSAGQAGANADTNGARCSLNAYLVSGAKSSAIFNFFSYSSNTLHKGFSVRTDRAGGGTDAIAAVWTKTNAVTSIMLYPSTGTFASGSSFALYGIVA